MFKKNKDKKANLPDDDISVTRYECHEYSRDGVLITKGQYDASEKKIGLWTEYYSDGIMASEENYENGKLHGEYRSYHENGSIWCMGNFMHGKKSGIFKIYNESKCIIIIQEYEDDKLIEEKKF